MQPPSHPLIEETTRTHSHNTELHTAAKSLLEETFDPSHPDIPQALNRLRQNKSPKLIITLKWLLPTLAAAIIFSLCYHGVKEIHFYTSTYNDLKSDYTITSSSLNLKNLTRDQILLLGEPGKTLLEQNQALHASAPDRPDYYSDFLTSYIIEHKRLPPDYFDVVSRIDPDNSYFIYLAAAVTATNAVKSKPFTNEQRDAKEIRTYDILDPVALGKSIDLYHRAAHLPHYESYQFQLASARIELLKSESYLGMIRSIAYIAMTKCPEIHLRKLANAVPAQAAVLASQQDRSELIRLYQSNEAFLNHVAKSSIFSLVGELIFLVNGIETSKALHHAIKALQIKGIDILEIRMPRIYEEEAWRKSRKNTPSDKDLDRRHFSLLQELATKESIRQIKTQVPLTKHDLAPSRISEHEVLSRHLILISACFILFCTIPIALFRYRSSSLIRHLSTRISNLIRPNDWAWIIIAGVILPLAFLFLISRHTPLGGRDYNIRTFDFAFPLHHYWLITTTLLATPLLIIRWRLRNIVAPLGLPTRSSPIGWCFLALGIVSAIATYPILHAFPESKTAQLIRIFPVIWLLAIFITALRALFEKKQLLISRTITASTLIIPYSIAVLLLTAMVPIITSSERNCITNDKITTPRPDAPSITPFEYKITQLRRIQTLHTLGLD